LPTVLERDQSLLGEARFALSRSRHSLALNLLRGVEHRDVEVHVLRAVAAGGCLDLPAQRQSLHAALDAGAAGRELASAWRRGLVGSAWSRLGSRLAQQLSVSPADRDALHVQTWRCVAEGQPEAAAHCVATLLQLEPDHPQVRTLEALVLALSGP